MPARLAALIMGCLATVGCASAVRGSDPAVSARPMMETPASLRGGVFRIEAEDLGRGFDIYVRLPDGYERSGARYPTVYLTDGDSLFPVLATNHLFLTYDDGLPEAIVVGVAYGGFDPAINLRNIDFQTPGEGVDRAGAAAFQKFLETELIPGVEARYRSDPQRRILFGQSRGGAFVLWSAIHAPDVFWGRIASNPSMTPGLESLLEAPAATDRDDLTLVLTSGTRDRADLQVEAAEWLAAWEARDDRPWALHGVRIEGATHAANATDAYRIGLARMFAGD